MPCVCHVSWAVTTTAINRPPSITLLTPNATDRSRPHITTAAQQVKATNGDTHLGGEDFDQRLMDYVISQFKRQHKVDVSTDKRALQRVRRECEKAKRALSVQTQTTIEVRVGGGFWCIVVCTCFVRDELGDAAPDSQAGAPTSPPATRAEWRCLPLLWGARLDREVQAQQTAQ